MKPKTSIYGGIIVPLLVEFTTQFIHTFWGTIVTKPSGYHQPNVNDSQSGHCVENNYLENVFMPAFQSGLSVWMQIVVFWKISVAHFNPAISMGFLVSGVLKPIMFLPYVLVQCLGSVIAAFVVKLILGQNPSVIVVPDDANMWSVFFSEAILTGVLIFFAVAMVVDKTYDQPTGPLAVGCTVFQGVLAARWVGVSCISPSRAFGPVLIVGGSAWNRHWLLWISDLFGAAFGSAYFMCFFAPKDKCWLYKFDFMKTTVFKNNRENEVMIEEKL